MTSQLKQTENTTLRRLPKRGSYDRTKAHAILDEARICHLGFNVDGHPFVVPTIHARLGNDLFVHGAPASRMLRTLESGAPVCLTVSIVDGLVLARSAFHHSMNYRSVMVMGRATLLEGLDEPMTALRALTERLIPGRWEDTRPPTTAELKATKVLRLPIEEASVKERSGPPSDDDEDYALPHWAGIVPLREAVGASIADPRLAPEIEVPNYLGRAEL